MTKLSAFEQIAKLETITVLHRNYVDVWSGVQRVVAMAQFTRTPGCCLLTGEAGVGKTNLCRAIVQSYESKTDRSAGYISNKVGAFYVAIPSPVSIKSLASVMLAKLGDPKPDYGTAQSMTTRLEKLAEESTVKLKILDEFHHLFSADASRGSNTRDNVRNWLKTLIDHVRVPIVLVGMPSCEELVNGEEQLSRRFPHRFRLRNIALMENDAPAFQQYLVTFADQARRVVGVNLPSFQDRIDAVRMFAATGGNPSRVCTLFTMALLEAIGLDSATTDAIAAPGEPAPMQLRDTDLTHFRTAADAPFFVTHRKTQKNPFEMELSAIFQELSSSTVVL